MKFIKKKMFTPLTLVIAILISAGGTWGLTQIGNAPKLTNEQLYAASIEDAMIAQKDEIETLVTITPDSHMITYNDAKDRILLLTWNKYPDSYPQGNEVVLQYGQVWTFSDKEMIKWYQENNNNIDDWEMRLRQLLGLKPDSAYTHVTAMWVKPEDVTRPAYQNDITKDKMSTEFVGETNEAFKTWFDENIIYSYYEDAYPWTRLGYTYDWSDNDTEYGLSEFLVEQGATVNIEYTMTTADFIKYLAKQ